MVERISRPIVQYAGSLGIWCFAASGLMSALAAGAGAAGSASDPRTGVSDSRRPNIVLIVDGDLGRRLEFQRPDRVVYAEPRRAGNVRETGDPIHMESSSNSST